VETGKVIEFSSDRLRQLRDEICRQHGYEPVSHQFHIFGVSSKGEQTRRGPSSKGQRTSPGREWRCGFSCSRESDCKESASVHCFMGKEINRRANHCKRLATLEAAAGSAECCINSTFCAGL